MLYNLPHSLSHLNTFGCLCYATAISPKQNFDSHVRQCIFIGYPLNKKKIQIIWYRCRHYFYKSVCHLAWRCFPILPIVPNAILASITRYFVRYWHWLTTPVQHSLDQPPTNQPSSPTRHKASEPPTNQPSSPTRHNAPKPQADQPSSPTSESLAPIIEPSPTTLPIRRSSRTSTPHSWLQDYVTGSQSNHSTTAQDWLNGTRYPMHHFLSNSQFSSTHSAYLANITTTKEPHTYAQAIIDPNWRKAMDEELSALQLNQTWTLTVLPAGQKPIGCKWVNKLKYNSNSSVNRYKARLQMGL